jgi:hypothetical protein
VNGKKSDTKGKVQKKYAQEERKYFFSTSRINTSTHQHINTMSSTHQHNRQHGAHDTGINHNVLKLVFQKG